MKKKCVPALLAIMLTFNTVNGFAASEAANSKTEITANTDKDQSLDDNILTVDEALTMATEYSRTLKNLSEQNEINELTADDTRIDLRWSNEYVEVTNLNVELKDLMNSLQNYDNNIEIEKEKLRLNIIEIFASIINAEDSVEMYDKEIELNERELKIAKIKNSLGLLSQTEYNSLITENEKIKSNKQSLESALEETYSSLNSVMGQPLSTRYTVELDVEYEPLGDVDLDYTITKATTSSQTIKDLENEAEIAEYKLDVYSHEYSGGYKETAQSNYAQATRNLEDAKTSMEADITSIYNNIKTSETEYANNTATLNQKKQELEVKKLQLELGKITQLEYDKAEYEIEQLENTIKQGVYSHYILVCKFNNPDLI